MKSVFSAQLGSCSKTAIAVATLSLVLAANISVTPLFAQSITVRGNSRVDSDAIRSYFTPGPGEKLDSTKIDQGLKDLVATGQFRDARVSRSGSGLVVTVVEGNVINRVVFQGNSKVKTDVLKGEIQSKSRGPFSQAIVDSDVRRLQEVYRRSGRNDAQISAKIEPAQNGRNDVTFVIAEGDKTGVYSINFVGNSHLSSYKLRNTMTTTESNFLSWLKSSDVYDPDRIAADLDLIRKVYMKNGYADMRVVSSDAEYSAEKKGFIITIVVDEGEQYRISNVNVESRISDIDPERLRSSVRSRAGNVYNSEDVDKSLDGINGEVAKRGYAFAQVRPRAERNVGDRSVNLVYTVEEGPRVFIERINVRGNTRTRDYVVRREFDMGEGDAYNKQLVDRAERRLKALGFFKNVKISNEPGSSPDRVIVNVDVEDQPTGSFGISGGYSTSDGIIGELSVSESNFLGRGQYVKVAGSNGQYSKGVELSFTEPFFMDRRIAAGFDLFAKENDYTRQSRYVIRNIGFNLRAGVAVNDEWTVGGRYSFFQQRITIPNTAKEPYANCYFGTGTPLTDYSKPACLNDGEASLAVLAAAGTRYTSLAGTSITYNTVDNLKNPTEGIFAQVNVDVAGLGGDSKYVRTTGETRYYYPIFDEIIGSIKGQAGNVTGFGSNKLALTDHFFKGPELVRGFAASGIGPRDVSADFSSNSIGGTSYYGGSVEVQAPIFGIPKEVGLKVAVFADAGTLLGYNGPKNYLVTQANQSVTGLKGAAPIGVGACYNGLITVGAGGAQCTQGISPSGNGGIRASVGAGLLWASPLGPIRFDYAVALKKGPLDKTQAFRFSGGTSF